MVLRSPSQVYPVRRWALAAVLLLCAGATRRVASGDSCNTETDDLDPGDSKTFSIAGGCPGRVFKIDVANLATSLDVSTSGGSGNGNLYLRFGTPPTETTFDYSSAGPSNSESLTVSNPAAGSWYVLVSPQPSFDNLTLFANFTAQETEVEDGQPVPDLGDDQAGQFTYFSFQVPPGSQEMLVTTTGGTGNPDLYVRPTYLPTLTSPNTVTSVHPSTMESVSIPSPQGGPWKIGLFANSAFAGVTLTVTIVPGGACVAADTALCLLANRFGVQVDWTNQHAANSTGVGHVITGSDQTGYFWFFDPANTELVVKVLDGRGVNGHFWVFYGGLSDVDFTIRVTDSASQTVKTYHHPPGTLGGQADTSAF